MIHLNMSSMADRHLVIAYAVILIAQFSYAGWVAWQWKRTRPTP
jgi:hypothetical protein